MSAYLIEKQFLWLREKVGELQSEAVRELKAAEKSVSGLSAERDSLDGWCAFWCFLAVTGWLGVVTLGAALFFGGCHR